MVRDAVVDAALHQPASAICAPLAEPRGLLGPASDGTLVASKAWTMQAPARTLEVLARMRLGREAVAEMDYMVNVQSMAPRAAAQAWMDSNATLVASWFATQ